MAVIKQSLAFNKRLVLNQYILSLFGVDSFEGLSIYVNKSENEGLSEDRISNFYYAVVNALPISGVKLNKETLLAYDQNIVSHTLAIQGKRPEPIRWKYFQYLALLFTEIYLDHYINARDDLLKDLNQFREQFNSTLPTSDRIEIFTKDDLRKIAFWSATGSGKTLIMHMNIKQYLHYLNKAGKMHKYNRILLITPNEGLSNQHLQELETSGIQAEIFSKQGLSLFTGHAVEIIEITKLTEFGGDKTVAVDAFENNNLVLVDEGHRGSSGDVWATNRRKLASQGFTFEYSATLGQAVAKDKNLAQEYAKSILFDYSYRYFYKDGYGKDYRILNLANDKDQSTRNLYLTACLLTFYQQKKLFKDPQSQVKPFNIENPLWIFVGGSVAKSTSKKDISDIVDILLFLARFTRSDNKQAVLNQIKRATSGNIGLLDPEGEDIFANMFPYLVEQSAEEIYVDIFQEVFNASSNGKLHIENLKGSDGEIAVKLGNNPPFGVINVGDTAALCKLCQEQDMLVVVEKQFSTSLFQEINREDSSINILIGSRKFTEGWSSWRVSTMGLMNVGKKEGSQIIQLFGRGVRLKGLDLSLRRHGTLIEYGVQHNAKLSQLETLNIFGLQANYMEQFETYLEEEGVPTKNNTEEVIIPVIPNLSYQKLKMIRLKEGLNFKKDGKKPFLEFNEKICRYKVSLDYYPRIQAHIAKDIRIKQEALIKNSAYFKAEHTTFIDIDAIYFDLQTFKNERSWSNLNITKQGIRDILSNHNWYEILIPQDQLNFDSFDKVNLWQNIASTLLQKYCDRFYKFCKDEWEAPKREYYDIDTSHPSFMTSECSISEYKVWIDKSQQQLVNQLKAIKNKIESKAVLSTDLFFGQGCALIFGCHLYQPLLHSEQKDIQIKPAALNKGEKKFIEDLRNFYQKETNFFMGKEFYLLRNMSKGRGLGFFEANNFHPDFIIWLIQGEKQYIFFVDPKGIRNLEPSDLKIEFHQTIKGIEKQLGNSNIILNSFIVSTTPYHEVKEKAGGITQEQFLLKHVLFQYDDIAYIKKIFKI